MAQNNKTTNPFSRHDILLKQLLQKASESKISLVKNIWSWSGLKQSDFFFIRRSPDQKKLVYELSEGNAYILVMFLLILWHEI